MEERRVTVLNEKAYFKALEKLKKDMKFAPGNKETILRYLREAELGKTILKGQKKKIGPSRLLRSLRFLTQLDHQWLKKPFQEVTREETEDFILRLERGIVRKSNGQPYTDETKTSLKKFLKKFYKWLLGHNEVYPDLVKYIDTSCKIPEIQPLTKNEVDQLITHATKPAHKFIIATLFDSGMRIEEFLNTHLSDLTPTDGCYKIRVTVSKTKPRTITLPLYPEIIDQHLQTHQLQNSPSHP